MPSKFANYSTLGNNFHVYFKNGVGISTIWGPMTYSSNRTYQPFDTETHLPVNEPLEARRVEIMFVGEPIPQELYTPIREAIGGKCAGEFPEGPYADVSVEEWMDVANILNQNA